MPVYNTELYIKRCIDSILAQTYSDWELLLIDDGSTDQSGEICDQYAGEYQQIRVIHNENQGPAASRACGVKNAVGDWIMFVDSDDWILPDMLQIMVEEQQRSGCAMVTCAYVDSEEGGKNVVQRSFSGEYIDCHDASECMMHMHRTRYLSGGPWGKLYRKKLFDGIDFCTDVTIGEDYAMIVQLAQKAGRVRMLNNPLYYRFVRKGSISHAGYTKRHEKAFDQYMKIRLELICKYPELTRDIVAFHTEYEMAVITAMCRNDNYDKVVIKKLKTDLKENMGNTLRYKHMPIYMKGCAVLIAYAHPVFIFLFRILYKVTGR